jgi:hypothetical protein
MAFHHPPPLILTVFQYVQLILAGNYQDIDLNPATNQIKTNDWLACRKMVCNNPHKLLETCRQIFDKFEKDPYLDDRVA